MESWVVERVSRRLDRSVVGFAYASIEKVVVYAASGS
jgi:hypothetical protein